MVRSASRTWARSQAWAGSVSLRWCQVRITGTGGTGNGRGRATRPSRVQTGRQTCSATVVTRSLRAARSSAAELVGVAAPADARHPVGADRLGGDLGAGRPGGADLHVGVAAGQVGDVGRRLGQQPDLNPRGGGG